MDVILITIFPRSIRYLKVWNVIIIEITDSNKNCSLLQYGNNYYNVEIITAVKSFIRLPPLVRRFLHTHDRTFINFHPEPVS
jgi:hypothetical protein